MPVPKGHKDGCKCFACKAYRAEVEQFNLINKVHSHSDDCGCDDCVTFIAGHHAACRCGSCVTLGGSDKARRELGVTARLLPYDYKSNGCQCRSCLKNRKKLSKSKPAVTGHEINCSCRHCRAVRKRNEMVESFARATKEAEGNTLDERMMDVETELGKARARISDLEAKEAGQKEEIADLEAAHRAHLTRFLALERAFNYCDKDTPNVLCHCADCRQKRTDYDNDRKATAKATPLGGCFYGYDKPDCEGCNYSDGCDKHREDNRRAAKSNGVTDCGHDNCILCDPDSSYNKARQAYREAHGEAHRSHRKRVEVSAPVSGEKSPEDRNQAILRKQAHGAVKDLLLDLRTTYDTLAGGSSEDRLHALSGSHTDAVRTARGAVQRAISALNFVDRGINTRDGDKAPVLWGVITNGVHRGLSPVNGCNCEHCAKYRKDNPDHNLVYGNELDADIGSRNAKDLDEPCDGTEFCECADCARFPTFVIKGNTEDMLAWIKRVRAEGTFRDCQDDDFCNCDACNYERSESFG